MLMTEQVTLRFRGVPIVDEAGRPVLDEHGNETFTPAREVDVRCWYEPRGSTEDTAAREQHVWGYWVAVDLVHDLRGVDAVVLEGEEFEIVGEPGRQPGGFLVPGFQKFACERVTG